MAPSISYNKIKSLNGWLTGLGGVDVILCLIVLAIAVGAGWPHTSKTLDNENVVGPIGMVLIVLVPVRAVELALSARWTWRLVENASSDIDRSRWAWLGWFVPVVSLWYPCRTILRFNTGASAATRWLVMAWWLTRWLSCPSGFSLLVIFLAVRDSLTSTYPTATDWLAWFVVIGVVSSALGMAVRRITLRRQPDGAAVQIATIF